MKYKSFLLVGVFILSGCANSQTKVIASNNVNINSGFNNGSVNLPPIKITTLKNAMNVSNLTKDDSKIPKKELFKIHTIKAVALNYGTELGFNNTNKKIDKIVMSEASYLTEIYNFNDFVIHESGGVNVEPPIIIDSNNNYDSAEQQQVIRTSTKYYRIIKNARLVPDSPLWQGYLIMPYKNPRIPSTEILPKNTLEKTYWDKYLKEGYVLGEKQSISAFKFNLNLLARNFDGMVLFDRLLVEKKVSEPIVASDNMGVTGNNNKMRINDTITRITNVSKFNVHNADDWSSYISSNPPEKSIK